MPDDGNKCGKESTKRLLEDLKNAIDHRDDIYTKNEGGRKETRQKVVVIVNFATKEYKVGQQRLMASLNGHPMLMFSRYEVIGSPTHQESPYEFKLRAIEKAFELDPIVLWMDASMWRVGNLSRIENIIKQDGYFLTEAGHYIDRWCNSHSREYFKFQPHEHHFIMFSAGLVGLNRDSEVAMLFFKQWNAAAKAGCFRGDYIDHRHDQTAGSIIAQRMNLKYQRGGEFMSYIGPGYEPPEPGSVIYLQGIV